MKVLAAVVVLVAAGIAALSGASCSVHRLSDGYTCDPSGNANQCAQGRFCDQGFCVETGSSGSSCPSPCTSCDDAHSCRIECSAGKPCGSVQCPPGRDCTVRCTSAGACGDVDCAQARSCDVACGSATACGNVSCGSNECTVRCAGSGACQTVDCAMSCSCDVSCPGPAACPPMFCPTSVLGDCTEDGTPATACSSSPPGCGLCIPTST